jgi:hypothetical protein
MKCFVLMPFGDRQSEPARFRRMEDLYSDWIKPTVESLQTPESEKIACHRADKDSGPGGIIEHVVENILTADIVIADLTGKNPNVFYELGVRHAVRDGTILVAEGIEHVPFDLRPLRTIIYEYTPSGMLAFRRDLENSIRTVLSNPQKIDNPVRRFVLESARPGISKETPDDHVIQNLHAEINSLRQDLLHQFSTVRDLMRVATGSIGHGQGKPAVRRFEGVWRAPKDGSVFCVKILGDDLHVPYCWGEREMLTGHLFNCVVKDDIITGRFEWLNSQMSGFVMLRAIGSDTLSGGWCLTENLPFEARNLSMIEKLPLDRLVELTVHRDGKANYPDWALQYFRDVQAK